MADRGTVGRELDTEPEDEATLEAFVVAAWFEDIEPEATASMLLAWHKNALANIARQTGIDTAGIKVTRFGDFYGEVGRRVRAAGFDTYDSDTRFIVFPGGQ